MGLKTTIQSKLGAAFDATLSDATKSVSIHDGAGTYDPATGDVTPAPTPYPTRAVISPYSARELATSNGVLTNKDFEAIILANEVAITIKVGMNLTIDGESETYAIEEVALDPAGAAYTLRIRS